MGKLMPSASTAAAADWSVTHRRLFLLAAAVQLITSATADPTPSSPPDIFSSVTELAKLMGREARFLRGLDQLATQMETSARILRTFHKVRIIDRG